MRGTRRIIIDEAQQAPHVFSRLRGAIDAARKRTGRFLLLGSIAPALMKNVSESLDGRLGLVHMTPLSLPELTKTFISIATFSLSLGARGKASARSL